MTHAQTAIPSRGIAIRPSAGAGALVCRWLVLAAIGLGLLPMPQASAQEPTTRPAAATEPPPAGAPTTQPTTATAPAGKGLLLNFKDASLQAVLEYLSESAGLVILNGTDAEGRVTIMSRNRLDTEEAVALLDTILKDKGYTAIRAGRVLKIVPLAGAAKENLPVYSGNDPSSVPVSDRLVTQIIPIQYADAQKLMTELAPLISPTATLTANQASNSLILVDTQTNIRRVMQIIRALDGHMAAVAEVKIYQLKYADAVNTSKLITELFKQDQSRQQAQRVFMPFARFGRRGGGDQGAGQASQAGGRQQRVIAAADERTNTLVVTAPPDLLKVIDGVVEELDSDPTEEWSVFIYPLKNAQAENVESVLNDIFSQTAGTRTTGPTTDTGGRTRFLTARTGAQLNVTALAGDLAGQVYVVADADTNSLLVRTATKHVDRVKQILSELDRATPQVLIKVLIAEVTHDDSLDLGTEFSALNLRFGTTGSMTVDFGTSETSGGLLTSTMDADLAATFNALQKMGKLDVLSRPYILASDNQAASITVGQEVPVITSTRTTGETGQTIVTTRYEDVGIILNVTPHINPEGLVIMDVAPEISAIADTTVPISEINATVIAKRSAQTRVAVADGQTIVIGGLMEDRIADEVRKVPGIGDIPLLGLLFQKKVQSKVKTELLIFLTPRVAQEPEKLKKISEEEEADSDAVREAVESGAFERHMRAMRRGATSRPAGEGDDSPR